MRITGIILAVTEETLRVVVLERLQAIWTPEEEKEMSEIWCMYSEADLSFDHLLTASWDGVPDSAQTHLFSGKLSRSLHAVVLFFSLQIHIQADTEAYKLIGQELVSWSWSLQFIFEHVDLALHGLKKEEMSRLEPEI